MKQFASLSLFALLSLVPAVASAGPKPATISIASKGSDQMYDKTKLTAKAGQTITLTFTNKSPADAGLQHNWVLANPGTQDAVAQAGMAAGADKGYIPTSADIIAHTKLLNSGEKDTITFTAPAKPGDYPYFCTFPGHTAMMKGILQIK